MGLAPVPAPWPVKKADRYNRSVSLRTSAARSGRGAEGEDHDGFRAGSRCAARRAGRHRARRLRLAAAAVPARRFRRRHARRRIAARTRADAARPVRDCRTVRHRRIRIPLLFAAAGACPVRRRMDGRRDPRADRPGDAQQLPVPSAARILQRLEARARLRPARAPHAARRAWPCGAAVGRRTRARCPVSRLVREVRARTTDVRVHARSPVRPDDVHVDLPPGPESPVQR